MGPGRAASRPPAPMTRPPAPRPTPASPAPTSRGRISTARAPPFRSPSRGPQCPAHARRDAGLLGQVRRGRQQQHRHHGKHQLSARLCQGGSRRRRGLCCDRPRVPWHPAARLWVQRAVCGRHGRGRRRRWSRPWVGGADLYPGHPGHHGQLVHPLGHPQRQRRQRGDCDGRFYGPVWPAAATIPPTATNTTLLAAPKPVAAAAHALPAGPANPRWLHVDHRERRRVLLSHRGCRGERRPVRHRRRRRARQHRAVHHLRGDGPLRHRHLLPDRESSATRRTGLRDDRRHALHGQIRPCQRPDAAGDDDWYSDNSITNGGWIICGTTTQVAISPASARPLTAAACSRAAPSPATGLQPS